MCLCLVVLIMKICFMDNVVDGCVVCGKCKIFFSGYLTYDWWVHFDKVGERREEIFRHTDQS